MIRRGWERIPAGTYPGGLWFRVTSGLTLLAEHGVAWPADASAAGASDAYLAEAILRGGGEARVFIYDGDSGECLATLIAGEVLK